jgi:hypothetical protein
MKAFFVSSSFIFITAITSAQVTITTPEYSLPEIVKPKIIGQSQYGKIYALPLDNMPCVVAPNANAALMPVAAKHFNTNNIPNGVNKFLFMPPIKSVKIRSNNSKRKTAITDYKPVTSQNLMLELIKKK